MNVLINCSVCKVGGGLQVASSFLNIIKTNLEFNFIFVLSDEVFNSIDVDSFHFNHKIILYNIPTGPFQTLFSSNSFLDSLVLKYNVNVVFTIFGPSYWRPEVVHICGYAKPHYIYINSPYFNIISLSEKIKLSFKKFFHLLDFKKNSDILITENSDVTRKLQHLFNKKVLTVTNFYNQVFDDSSTWKKIKLPDFDGKYILTVSANYKHKNLRIIPLVILELINRGIKKFKFVLTIDRSELVYFDKRIDDYIIFLGKINVESCPYLYEQSEYMFLPTLLECFSSTYVEAMRMKSIVLTSDLDFAHGICLDSAVYFDPLDPVDIVNKLIEVDNNQVKKDLLISNGIFRLKSFDNYNTRAVKYLDIIKNEANNSVL